MYIEYRCKTLNNGTGAKIWCTDNFKEIFMTRCIILDNYIDKRHYDEIKFSENLNLMEIIIYFNKLYSSPNLMSVIISFRKIILLQFSQKSKIKERQNIK